MKKIIFFILCFVPVASIYAQSETTDSQKFLKRYEMLISRIQDRYSQNEDSVYAWKEERNKIKTLYKERYNAKFTDEEIEKYTELSAVYRSKMAEYNLNNFGEKMDSVGQKVSRSVHRTSKKVSGFLKGLKKQSDRNRKIE